MAKLPRVQEELFNGKILRLKDTEYQTGMYRNIKEENPVLWNMILIVLNEDSWSQDKKDGYCKGAAQFYDLLRSQAEVDELEEQHQAS